MSGWIRGSVSLDGYKRIIDSNVMVSHSQFPPSQQGLTNLLSVL